MSEEKKIYFQNTKKIIDFLGKGEILLSELYLGIIPELNVDILESKNYIKIYSIGSLMSDKPYFTEIIYEHPSGFYIYFSKEISEINYQIKIIYTPEKYKEIIMFINQLKKFKK